MRVWLFLAGINGAAAVAMGAVAAHAFPGDATAAGLVDKAARYELTHAVALLGVALLARHRPSWPVMAAGGLFTLGCLLFCGSVYALGFKLIAAAPLAPVGGSSFILGWLALAAAAFASTGGDAG